MKTEEWRQIPGFSAYDVSNLGRIRSYYFGDSQGDPKIKSLQLERRAPGQPEYARVCLTDDKGKFRRPRVHRLVLLAFVSAPPSQKHQGSHLDGNSTNNWVENLAWMTQKENEALKEEHGTKAEGVRNGQHVLTAAQFRKILNVKVWKPGMVTRFAEKFGVTVGAISKIKLGQRWKHMQ